MVLGHKIHHRPYNLLLRTYPMLKIVGVATVQLLDVLTGAYFPQFLQANASTVPYIIFHLCLDSNTSCLNTNNLHKLFVSCMHTIYLD
jgi:hypothetical protein